MAMLLSHWRDVVQRLHLRFKTNIISNKELLSDAGWFSSSTQSTKLHKLNSTTFFKSCFSLLVSTDIVFSILTRYFINDLCFCFLVFPVLQYELLINQWGGGDGMESVNEWNGIIWRYVGWGRGKGLLALGIWDYLTVHLICVFTGVPITVWLVVPHLVAPERFCTMFKKYIYICHTKHCLKNASITF